MRRASPRSPPSAAPGRGLRRLHVPRVRWPPPAPARALPAVPAAVASSVGVCGAGLCAERLPHTAPTASSVVLAVRGGETTAPQRGGGTPQFHRREHAGLQDQGCGRRPRRVTCLCPPDRVPVAPVRTPSAAPRASWVPWGPAPPSPSVDHEILVPRPSRAPAQRFLQGPDRSSVPHKRFPPVSQLSDEVPPPPSLVSVWHLLEFGAQMLPSGQYFLLSIPHTSDPTVTAIRSSLSFFFLLLL